MLLYNFLIVKVSKYILKIHNFSTHYHHPFQQIFITCLQHRSHCADYSSVSLFSPWWSGKSRGFRVRRICLGLDFNFATYCLCYLGSISQLLLSLLSLSIKYQLQREIIPIEENIRKFSSMKAGTY